MASAICQPPDLDPAYACFICLTVDQRASVLTYLLAVLAGGSLDPGVLLQAAKCFACLTPGQKATIESYLLCQLIQDGCSGGGGGLAAPTISFFGNSNPLAELGITVNSTTLNWTLGGGAAASQSLNQGLGSVPVGTLTKIDLAAYSTNRTYTLTITNATGSVSANSSVTFMNKVYWGVSALTSLNDAQIIALSGQLQTTRLQTRIFTPSGEYIYMAWPTSYGTPTFTVNGFPNNDWVLVTRAFTNASGYTESYDIYRSTNLLFSTFTVQVL